MIRCLYCGTLHDRGQPCPPEIIHESECDTGREIMLAIKDDYNWSVVDLNGPSGDLWRTIGERFETRWPLTEVRVGYREAMLRFGSFGA